jgi:thiol-disulfide isomerase/thioredoxin
MRFLAGALWLGSLAWAWAPQATAQGAAQGTPQQPAKPPAMPPATLPPAVANDEERQLGQALGEAGTSPVDFMRALEKHLAMFPNSPRRNQIERALVKAAIEAKDDTRIAEYGERVLAREPADAQILDKVISALLTKSDADCSARALKYAKSYEELLRATRSQNPPGHFSEVQWHEEVDKGLGRVLASEARASGNLGRIDEAVVLARRGYETYPSAQAAREIGRWLLRAGKLQEAIAPYADAFAIPDPRNTEGERAQDRAELGDIYRQLNGSEKALGDLILEAYDRTTGQLAARRLRLRQNDPNAQATSIREFTLTSPDGHKLPVASLAGKAVVFDFWATWCGPCRAQHRLYEQVMQRFHDAHDVVFLFINTDEERDAVAPFLKNSHWDPQQVYFEDGLSRVLSITSIPTTIVLDRRGEVFSRMNGYLPDRFVEMLSDRIRDALKN